MGWYTLKDGSIVRAANDSIASEYAKAGGVPYTSSESEQPAAQPGAMRIFGDRGLPSAFTAADVISPRNAAAQREGAGWPARFAASTEDVLTFPLRAIAGAGNAAGELAGSRSLAGVPQAFAQGMANPNAAFEQNLSDAGVTNPFIRGGLRGLAAPADNPLTLPMMGLTPAVAGTPLNPIGQGLAAGLAQGVTRRGEQALSGAKPESGITGEDVLPVALGAGTQALFGLAPYASAMREKAADLVRKAGKPGEDPEVVESGRNFLVGMGYLPELISGGTFTPEGMARRFAALKDPLARAVGAREAEADAAGVRINMEEALRNARDQMRGQQDTRRLALSEPEFERSYEWLKDRALVPDAISREQIAQSEIPYQGRTVPLIGKEDVFQQVRGEPVLNEKGQQVVGPDLMPQYTSIPVLAGQRDVISGYQKLPDYYPPRPDVTSNVSAAGNLKRAMQKIAYENDPSATAPMAGRVAGARGFEQAIRSQLREKAPAVAQATEQVAPFYDAQEYFNRLERRGNNLEATPWKPLVWAHIKGARALWDASKFLEAAQAARDATNTAVRVAPLMASSAPQ